MSLREEIEAQRNHATRCTCYRCEALDAVLVIADKHEDKLAEAESRYATALHEIRLLRERLVEREAGSEHKPEAKAEFPACGICGVQHPNHPYLGHTYAPKSQAREERPALAEMIDELEKIPDGWDHTRNRSVENILRVFAERLGKS